MHDLVLGIWVNYHNLFTLVASAWLTLLPGAIEAHHALNLLCAVLGALTVHVIFLVGLHLTENLFASALGALVLMVSHSLWWHSTMLEVYTLSALLMALAILFVIRFERSARLRDLCGSAFFLGLACSNHAQMWLLVPSFLAVLLASGRFRSLATGRTTGMLAFAFFTGFQVYLWVFAAELIARSGSDVATLSSVLGDMLHQTTGAGFRRYMFESGLTLSERMLWWLFFVGLLIYNFASPAILLGPLGMWAWWRSGNYRMTFAFVALCFIAQLIFASNYFVWDMYAFSLPVYVLFAIGVIAGIDWVHRRSKTLRSLVYLVSPTFFVTPLVYANTADWLASSQRAVELLDSMPQYRQAKGLWDPLAYFFDPNKRGFDQVERYAEQVMRQLEPSACYWGDEAKLVYPLKYYYQGVLGRRTDVRYNVIFATLRGDGEFGVHAITIVDQLRRECPVYVSSVGYPERDVMNHVYSILDPQTSAPQAALLSKEAFIKSFPNYRLQPMEIDPSADATIYKLVRRATERDPDP